MHVRSASHADLPGLLPLYRQLALDEAAYQEPDLATAAAQLDRILQSDDFDLLVAVTPDGIIAGTATLAVIPNLSSGARPWCAVEAVVVDRRFRGQGAGRALMERAIAIARQRGCYKVELQSRHERTWAHGFYTRLGFAQIANGYKLYFDEASTRTS